MAYEKMDKAAIAKMAEQYDKDTAPGPAPKMGWFGRLIASFGSIETVSSEEHYHPPIGYNDTPICPRDSHYNVSHYTRNSGIYSPILGSDD